MTYARVYEHHVTYQINQMLCGLYTKKRNITVDNEEKTRKCYGLMSMNNGMHQLFEESD